MQADTNTAKGFSVGDKAPLRELKEILEEGGWRPLAGGPGRLIYIRVWPDDSVDTLAFTGETTALAERTNPAGDPVWRRRGILTEVIAELRDVPAPDAPSAPRLVLPGDADDRNL